MQKLFLFLTLSVLNLSYSNNIFEIPLGKTDKLQGTYSALLGKNTTAHFVLIRSSESKQYELTPFIVDSAAKVTRLETYSSKEVPEIISHHQNGNIVSVIAYNKVQKAIFLLDFDILSGKLDVAKHDQKEDYDHIFRLTDKTIIIQFDSSNHAINYKSITNHKTFEEIRFTVPADKVKLFKKISWKTPESLNQQEFVKNGSINELKAYFAEGKLTYTLEKDKAAIQVFQFDTAKKDDFTYQNIALGFAKESKEMATYVIDNKLVALATEKEDVKMKTFDLATGTQIVMFSVRDDLTQVVNSEQLTAYLKATAKSAMKPTVTVNKTSDQNLAIRLDQVNKMEYAYYYNWWLHHWFIQQQMWHQQQMMRHMQMTMPRGGFGPSPESYDSFTGYLSAEKAKSVKIEFVLKPDFKSVHPEESTPVFREIDKDKYVDKYKDDKNIKEFSSEFAESEMRYIYLDRKAKVIRIAATALE